jgi:site-specific DNA recombinase
MRALLYARVSRVSPGQGGAEGAKSVDDQLAELRAEASRQGWTAVGEYRDDGISASRYSGKARPAWQRVMVALTEGEVDVLSVWEISRATRDRPVWAALLAACQEGKIQIATGGKLHDPNDPDDGFMLDLQAALAVRESATTSKRVLRAVRSRAAEGRPHGKLAYGYRIEYDSDTGRPKGRVLDPDTAPVVREIVKRLNPLGVSGGSIS